MMKKLQMKFIQKEKYKMKGENRNSKKDNNSVIYEALANKLRSSLLGDKFIYLILIII